MCRLQPTLWIKPVTCVTCPKLTESHCAMWHADSTVCLVSAPGIGAPDAPDCRLAAHKVCHRRPHRACAAKCTSWEALMFSTSAAVSQACCRSPESSMACACSICTSPGRVWIACMMPNLCTGKTIGKDVHTTLIARQHDSCAGGGRKSGTNVYAATCEDSRPMLRLRPLSSRASTVAHGCNEECKNQCRPGAWAADARAVQPRDSRCPVAGTPRPLAARTAALRVAAVFGCSFCSSRMPMVVMLPLNYPNDQVQCKED